MRNGPKSIDIGGKLIHNAKYIWDFCLALAICYAVVHFLL